MTALLRKKGNSFPSMTAYTRAQITFHCFSTYLSDLDLTQLQSQPIEKVFLMVHIAKKDRDSLRFLWLRDPLDCHSEPLHFHFTRLVFGLRPVITYHLEKYKSKECRIIELLKESLYVDDLVAGAANEEEGMQLHQTAKSILLDVGMNLRKWQSNSPVLMQQIQLAKDHHTQTSTKKIEITVTEEESFTNSQVGTFESKDSNP